MKIAVIGLGKLGAPMAAVLAAAGHRVVGYDLDKIAVDALQNGRAPVDETDLQETIDAAGERLSATTDLSRALEGAELSIVIVPTPSLPDGSFDARYAVEAVQQIGRCLRGRSERHVVSLASTVLPGTTGGAMREALEEASNQCLADTDSTIGLCYNPAFIALGSVVHNLRNPDLVLIGREDAAAGDVVEAAWRPSWENSPVVARLKTVDAELSKISVNSFVTMKISFANTIAELCERTPGADAAAVLSAIGHDSRIGKKYLMPGLGFGGPCFPRDNHAFGSFAHSFGWDAPLAKATDQVNNRQVERLTARIAAHLPSGSSVAILGLSYKPGTAVVEASQAVDLANTLSGTGYDVRVWDPEAMATARRELDRKVTMADSLDAAVDGIDAIVIATPWPEIVKVANRLAARDDTTPRLIVDLWHCIDAEDRQGLLVIGRFAESSSDIESGFDIVREAGG